MTQAGFLILIKGVFHTNFSTTAPEFLIFTEMWGWRVYYFEKWCVPHEFQYNCSRVSYFLGNVRLSFLFWERVCFTLISVQPLPSFLFTRKCQAEFLILRKGVLHTNFSTTAPEFLVSSERSGWISVLGYFLWEGRFRAAFVNAFRITRKRTHPTPSNKFPSYLFSPQRGGCHRRGATRRATGPCKYLDEMFPKRRFFFVGDAPLVSDKNRFWNAFLESGVSYLLP